MIFAGLTHTAVGAEQTATSLPNPFYAYCVGIGVGKEAGTLEAQLKLPAILADLAYSGTAFVGLDGALEMLGALENRGQRLFAVYTPLSVDAGDRGYDPKLTELIPKLKGHGTVVWLVLNSKQHKPSSTGGDAAPWSCSEKSRTRHNGSEYLSRCIHIAAPMRADGRCRPAGSEG